MKYITSTLAAIFLAGGLATATQAEAAKDTVIIYDASGSMWGQIDNVSKVEIARDVMTNLINKWDNSTHLGLVAYGHRSKGDCADIETLVEPGPLDKTKFIKTINDINPKGKTPISASLQHAAELLSYRDSQASVVLISDGIETCNADPCAVAKQLAAQGVNFTAHVVGFDIESDDHASLACIAENTGGLFVPASNATELHAALAQVQDAMEQPASEPEPEPEPSIPEVAITGPQQVTAGATFDVQWSQNINKSDMVTIVPSGAKEGTHGNYKRVGDSNQTSLTAPADTGLYELRYILNEGSKTLATADIEVTDTEVTITGPQQVTAGATFDVQWSQNINKSDMVTIVPSGAKEGTHGNYKRVGDSNQTSLTAPADTGLYELRYILNEGGKTVATADIEVTDTEVTITGPQQVTAGATFDVQWSQNINKSDMVTIVPSGAKEGTHGNYKRVGDNNQTSLTAPADTGLYELRYILNEGGKTLATADIEVTDTEVTITGPQQVTAGATFDVQWSQNINKSDMITIVPSGAKEGTHGNYKRVGDNNQTSLTAPAETGLYELRYILNAGGKTVATADIEVTAPEVNISAPEVVRAGGNLEITWSTSINNRDMVTILPLGSKEGARGNYKRVGNNTAMTMTAPSDTGLYEVRYIMDAGHKTLATAPLEVVAATASLDAGVGLSVPASAAVGEVIEVTWTHSDPSKDQRIALARSSQADFTWISAQSIAEENSIALTMPEQKGFYEVRFIDISEREVLARSIIEVK